MTPGFMELVERVATLEAGYLALQGQIDTTKAHPVVSQQSAQVIKAFLQDVSQQQAGIVKQHAQILDKIETQDSFLHQVPDLFAAVTMLKNRVQTLEWAVAELNGPAVAHVAGLLADSLMQTIVQNLSKVEAQLAPVLWVCEYVHCGAPNETPRILWPIGNTVTAVLYCLSCGCVQHSDYLKQFDPL